MPENQSVRARRVRARGRWFGLAALLLLSPLLVPLLVVMALAWIAGAVALHLLTLILWLPVGRRVLFIYSNSPVWKTHIETEILPRLPPTAAVLNWSERSRWTSLSLAVLMFRFYGGSRQYNPLAIVIQPWRGPRLFRFWDAFRDFKHGKHDSLRSVEAALFHAVSS